MRHNSGSVIVNKQNLTTHASSVKENAALFKKLKHSVNLTLTKFESKETSCMVSFSEQ